MDETKEQKRKRKQEKKEKKKRKRDSLESISSAGHENERSQEQSINKDCAEKDGNSLQFKNLSILLSLDPSAMYDIKRETERAVQSMLLKYSDGLGGILLGYDNLKVDKKKNGGETGRILNEMPHIHFYVTCRALVFTPTAGKYMTGMISETFPSHVGVLVHDLFNATISADHLRESGFTFDVDLNEWVREDTMAPIVVGDALKFYVDKIHEYYGVLSLECTKPTAI